MPNLWMQRNNSPTKKTNLIQQFCGTFLYYAMAINNTILPALSGISSEQSKAMENTAKKVAKLLNYLASNPNAEIQYRDSGMQLSMHSDASYLSVCQSRSQASCVHFLSEVPPNPKIQRTSYPPPTASY